MKRLGWILAVAFAVLAVAACGDDGNTGPDSGTPDSGYVDSGIPDSGGPYTGTQPGSAPWVQVR